MPHTQKENTKKQRWKRTDQNFENRKKLSFLRTEDLKKNYVTAMDATKVF